MDSNILERVFTSSINVAYNKNVGLFVKTIASQLCERVEDKIIEYVTEAIGDNNYYIINFKVMMIPDKDLGSNGLLLTGDIVSNEPSEVKGIDEVFKQFGKGTGINTYPNQGGISNPYYYQPIPGTLGTITCNSGYMTTATSAKINTSSDEDTIASLNDLGGTNE